VKIHQLDIKEAYASLNSSAQGLTDPEAVRRLAEFGPNEIEKAQGERLVRVLVRQFFNFFANILWIAAGLAFLAEWFDPGQGMALLGFAVIGVIVVNGTFSFWQVRRAEMAIETLRKLLPKTASVFRGGVMRLVPVTELVPGDVVLLEAGDCVPADSRIVEAFSVRVSNATITGESQPHSRDARPCDAHELLESRNVLLAGTAVISGQASALVFATGVHSFLGRMAGLAQAAPEPLSPLQKEISRMSWIIAIGALSLGALFFVIGRAVELPFWANLVFSIGVIVALVPEGLLPEVTLALAMASQRMARRNALVRHLPAVETLGCTTVICTDKTGTLTRNRMTVQRVFLGGCDYPAQTTPQAPLLDAHHRFFEIAACCHDLRATSASGSQTLRGDPTEIALVEFAARLLPDLPKAPRIGQISFDSDRKRLSTLHALGDDVVLYCKGAPEIVIPRCAKFVENDGGVAPMTREAHARFLEVADAMARDGLRVLAFAFSEKVDTAALEHAEEGMTFSGLVGLEDPPRPEVLEAVRQCRKAGIRIIMITGDHPHTALAIARQVEIVRSASPQVLDGPHLSRLSDTQLQLALDAPEILFARVAADQKMRIVTALKRKGEIVAVTGDGVNDAPALKHADIGISMGAVGTDVARESSDMILLDDNFASIVAAVEEGRAIFANIRKFLTYVLSSNVAELVPYLAFVLFRIPLPLTVMQILVVDLGTDVVSALALGAEKASPEVMSLPPRSRTERLLNIPLLLRSYGFLGIMEACAGMAAFFYMAMGGGWRPGESLDSRSLLYMTATTACLGAIIAMQMVNVFLCRSERQSLLRRDFFANRLIFVGVLVEMLVAAAVIYTPWGHFIFGNASLPASFWLFVVPFGMAMIILEEGRKLLVRLGARISPRSPCVR
jgi:calcium-translocating P-type ATPase